MSGERWQRAQGIRATGAGNRSSYTLLHGPDGQSIPPRTWLAAGTVAKKRLLTAVKRIRVRESSASPVGTTRRRYTIRQEIIGRTFRLCGTRVAPGDVARYVMGNFMRNFARDLGSNLRSRRLQALVDQPTSQHRRGVLLQPLVEELADLFTQVRGMSQTRKFIGLQGVAGSGEKKLPGGLNTIFGHGDAPKNEQVFNVTVLTKTY